MLKHLKCSGFEVTFIGTPKRLLKKRKKRSNLFTASQELFTLVLSDEKTDGSNLCMDNGSLSFTFCANDTRYWRRISDRAHNTKELAIVVHIVSPLYLIVNSNSCANFFRFLNADTSIERPKFSGPLHSKLLLFH